MFEYGKYARNIAKGKLPYENWNQFYINYQKSVNVLSDVQFSLNFISVMYTEELWEEETTAALGKRFLEILYKVADADYDLEAVGEDIKSFRETMKNHMDCLVTFTDHFLTYQYVMNCMRYRFEDYDYEDYDDEEFSKELLQYICADQDQSAVRYKTMEVLKTLPIRMTRNRFFEMVKNGYSVYLGSDLDTLQSFDYMVRGAAMLHDPEHMEENFPDLYQYDHHFSALDYDNLDGETFYKEDFSMQECVDYLNNQITACQALSEAINQLYAFTLSHEYANPAGKVYTTCRKIVSYVREHCVPGEPIDLDEQLTDYLEELEGAQEEELDVLAEADGHFQDILQTAFAASAPEQIKEEMNCVGMMSDLLSTSYFADLGEKQEPVEATQEDIDRLFGSLRLELEPRLKEMPKLMNRGIMSAVIGYLPMNFADTDELQQYIYNSLKACTSLPEKMALVERLEQLMDEDDWE